MRLGSLPHTRLGQSALMKVRDSLLTCRLPELSFRKERSSLTTAEEKRVLPRPVVAETRPDSRAGDAHGLGRQVDDHLAMHRSHSDVVHFSSVHSIGCWIITEASRSATTIRLSENH